MSDTDSNARHQFLTDVADAMADLAARTATAANCYRRSNLADGHAVLATVMAELQQFGSVLTALDQLGVDSTQFDRAGLPVAGAIDELGHWLTQLVQAHEAADWLTLADVLELDLEPALRAWSPALIRLAGRPAA